MEGGLDWVAELAWHEWQITPEQFYDDRPNTGECFWVVGGRATRFRPPLGVAADTVWRAPSSYGVTLPVLFSLVEQYADRRQREMAEDATASALGYHDPKGIAALRQNNDQPDYEEDSEFERAPWRR